MIKNKLFYSIVAIVIILFSACSSTASEMEELDLEENLEDDTPAVTIGISIPYATHGWTMGVIYYTELKAQEVANENGWDYKLYVANDALEQITHLKDLIEDEVDVVVLLPYEGASLGSTAAAVEAAGIPLVIFDREIPGFEPTALVKGDNVGIGIEAAKYLNNTFSESTTVLTFMGDSSTVPQQRQSGFEETIRDNIMHIEIGYTDWQRDVTKKMFETWAIEHSQDEINAVEAIYTHDDEVALGILDALMALEEDDSFFKHFNNLKVLVGCGGSQAFYEQILSSETIDVVTLLYSPKMIQDAIDVAANIVKGLPYDANTIVASKLVSKENVLDYLDKNVPY